MPDKLGWSHGFGNSLPMPRQTKDKSKALAAAKKTGRKVLWLDERGYWHASTNRDNTPHYAVQTEDVE